MSGLTPEQEWEWRRRPEHHREGVLWAEIDRLRKYHAELDGAFRAWRQEHRDELEAQCERADRAEAELDRLRERIAVLDSAILEWRAEEGRQELVRERADRATQAIRNALALRMDDHVHHHAYEKKARAILREGLTE